MAKPATETPPLTKFVSDSVWKELAPRLAEPGPRRAAIAYASRRAPGLLRLSTGDSIVVDASPNALGRGVTHPDAIEEWIDAGVEVRSMKGLHAKVIVFGDKAAVVGSANASANSEKDLIEAAMVTEDPEVVRQVGLFLDQLRDESDFGGAPLTHAWVAKARTLFKEPQPGPRKRRNRTPAPPPTASLWIVPWVEVGAYGPEAEANWESLRSHRMNLMWTFNEDDRETLASGTHALLFVDIKDHDTPPHWSRWVAPPSLVHSVQQFDGEDFIVSHDPPPGDEVEWREIAAVLKRHGYPHRDLGFFQQGPLDSPVAADVLALFEPPKKKAASS